MLHPSSDLFKFYDTELAAAAASLLISGVPLGGKSILVMGALRTDAAAAFSSLQVFFNGDTGVSYAYIRGNLETTGAWTTGSNVSTATPIPLSVAGGTGPVDCFSRFVMEVFDYDATNKQKEAIVDGWVTKAFSAGNIERYVGGLTWKNTDPINSITIEALSGDNFVIGSRLTAYVRL